MPPPHPRKPLTRYHCHVTVDLLSTHKGAALIIDEVVECLTSLLGTKISARKSDGFDESIVRTISENRKTLKFEGFEEG